MVQARPITSLWIVIPSMPTPTASAMTDSARFASPARSALRNASRASVSGAVSAVRVAAIGPEATSSAASATGPGRASM